MIKLKHLRRTCTTIYILLQAIIPALAEDGYRLWLRYDKIEDQSIRSAYLESIQQVYIDGESAMLRRVFSPITFQIAWVARDLVGEYKPPETGL